MQKAEREAPCVSTAPRPRPRRRYGNRFGDARALEFVSHFNFKQRTGPEAFFKIWGVSNLAQ